MKLLKRITFLFLFLILLICACILYAFKIEPYRITVNPYTPNENQTSETSVKIAQISDIHIKEDYKASDFHKVVEKLNELSPDIVIFTGDLYDNYAIYHEDEQIIQELSQIDAKYAKIAIWGNRDYGGGAVRQYDTIMEQSGFTLLKNGNWYITLESGKQLLFTGLDDTLLGNPDMPYATRLYASDYEILLTHEPDTAKQYNAEDYELILSGHSHGGQINIPFLPFINELATSSTSLSTNFPGGMYQLSDIDPRTLYVNTGIGTTHISARFGVVPEISLFHITF